MSIEGVDRIVYGVENVADCRKYFLDWGLTLIREGSESLDFESLNGCEIQVRSKDDPTLPPAFEPGSTLRQVVWGVAAESDLARLRSALSGTAEFTDGAQMLHCTDPNGMALGFRVTRKRSIEAVGVRSNTWGHAPSRVDQPGRVYEHAQPVEVGHIVFFTPDLAAVEAFYTNTLGFVVSDRYPGRALFMRCAEFGGHHDAFFLQLPTGKRGLNHVAFTVRDIHEVFGGGLHFSRCGWQTDLGPGRHPVSSAYFWYFKCPAGAMTEYYADEDQLSPAWKARDMEFRPENFAEWAILGGLDGTTRRQKTGPGSEAHVMAGQAVRK